ncbi:MAG: zinc ribbon domain-containing protein [Lentisphaerota bacterium]
MFCRNCKRELSDKAVLCIACGCPPKAGTKYCGNCGNEIDPLAALCVKCGNSLNPANAAPTFNVKNRLTYILLGILLGLIGLPGIHNLYAGYTGKGLTQLLISILSCGLLWIPMYIWALVEACTITVDSHGNPMN